MTNAGVNGFPSSTGSPPDGSVTLQKLASPGALGKLSSGRYYFTASPHSSSTSATLGTGTLRVVPWVVPNTCTLSRIGASVTSAGDSGSKFRLGIYADDGTGYPGQLVLDAGTIAGDSNTVQEITINQLLAAGLYWVGGAVQVVSVTQPTITTTNAPPGILAVPNGSQPAAAGAATGVSMTSVTGAFTQVFSSTVSSAGATPRLFVKVA